MLFHLTNERASCKTSDVNNVRLARFVFLTYYVRRKASILLFSIVLIYVVIQRVVKNYFCDCRLSIIIGVLNTCVFSCKIKVENNKNKHKFSNSTYVYIIVLILNDINI